MKKPQSTDHSLSKLHKKLISKILILLVLFIGPAFILKTQLLHAEIKIAIVDTGFCPERISSKFKIESSLDLTKSVKFNCDKMDTTQARFHGQLVLEEFLKFYDNKKNKLHLYPLIVYDNSGEQKKEYWLAAIDWIKKNKIDVVLSASGLITEEKIMKDLPSLWFVPSGRVSPKIKEHTGLFPQNLAPKENLFLVGDYHDGKTKLYDQSLLYQDKIDYYFPSGEGIFNGTSRAVSEALARALNLCPIKDMRSCLSKLSKEYRDDLSQRKFKTY